MDAPAPIVIGHGPSAITLHVVSAEAACHALASEFSAAAADHDAEQPAIVTHARFLAFCARQPGGQDAAAAVLAVFDDIYCRPSNTHILRVVDRLALSDSDRAAVLRSYYAGWMAAPDESRACHVELPAALAVFGGAVGGASGAECLALARELVGVYQPLVAEFLAAVSRFAGDETQDAYIAHCYPHGLDMGAWITGSSAPPAEYLDSPPVALPLLGLVQLLRLVVLSGMAGLTVSQLVKQLEGKLTQLPVFLLATMVSTIGVTGHGHGLVVAAAAACAGGDEAGFVAASQTAVGMLMLCGCLPQLVSPQPALHPLAAADCAGVEGVPTPMASVEGVPRQIVEVVLEKYNKFVKDDPEAHVHLAVADSDARFVLAGNTRSLVQFVLNVRKRAAAPNEDQSAVPFLSRKPEATVRFVPVAAPLHSAHMSPVLERHAAYAAEKGWAFDPAAMAAPLRSSRDGSDLRTRAASPAELTRLVLKCVYVDAVDWPCALRPDPAAAVPACVLSFAVGDALLDATCANVDGYGTAVVCADMAAGAAAADADACGTARPCVRPLAGLFGPAGVLQVESWEQRFAPQLVRTAAAATVHIDTPLHRATGLPPVFVGAAAAISSPELVAAASRGGYLAELDASHAESEEALVQLVADTVALVQPGHGVALSCSWTAQHEWLVPAVRHALDKLRLPVLGLCIADGVPETLAAALAELHAAGLRYVAVRAGTALQIRQAIALAQAHPALPVVLQWTGGRCGGRHSLDDFHIPVLQTYAEIRAQPNIVLVAASGMGDAESTLPYITGSWGALFGRAAMPFDGVMLVSRVVCARESAAAPAIKQLIVDAPGIDGLDLPALFGTD
ncbi:fatty acid synthase alpha subunit Lsd1, partial [Coemansia spiralis]